LKIVESPWRNECLSLVASAKKELRIVAPFYGRDIISAILENSSRSATKYFLLALSDQGISDQSQSVAALHLLQNDISCNVRFVKNLHAKMLIADNDHAIVTSSNLTTPGLDSNVRSRCPN
jgi:phosphatidylserine/phosphatidylglycerophosphate/cardiolipin synthase-like enzyme